MKILKKNIVIRYPPLKLRHQRCVDAITVNQGQEYSFLSIDNNRRLNYSFKLLDSVTQCSSTTTQKQCGK